MAERTSSKPAVDKSRCCALWNFSNDQRQLSSVWEQEAEHLTAAGIEIEKPIFYGPPRGPDGCPSASSAVQSNATGEVI